MDKFEPSSKLGSHCGDVFKELSLKRRSGTCRSCVTHYDRDANAAINIKIPGLRTGLQPLTWPNRPYVWLRNPLVFSQRVVQLNNQTMCAVKRKTWKEKLNIDRKPQIENADKDFAGIKAGQMMLIPTPKVVDAYIRQIPEGMEVDLSTLRQDLAAEYHAEVTCPLTTGIFVRIAAEAAFEEFQNGTPVEKITPFWRVINEKSSTAKKLSFGIEFLKIQRKKEGL
jgi:hypothetical protein